MHVSLGQDLQEFVDAKVRSGQFQSPEDVVRGALAFLKAQETATPEDLLELRKLLGPAVEQADRGELTPLDLDDVKRKAEARRTGRRVGWWAGS